MKNNLISKEKFINDFKDPIECIERFWNSIDVAISIYKACISTVNPIYCNNYCIEIFFNNNYLYILPNEYHGWHYNIYMVKEKLPTINSEKTYFDITQLEKDLLVCTISELTELYNYFLNITEN